MIYLEGDRDNAMKDPALLALLDNPSASEVLRAYQSEQHFQARTRTVLLAPYERLIDSGEPLRYNGLSSQTKMAWQKIAAAVAEGL